MHIAVAGLLTKKIEPHPFGGTEAFTYLLVKGLVENGHEVTLYSAEGSQTDAQHHVAICSAEDAMKHESNIEFVYPYTLLQIRRILDDMKSQTFDLLHINALKTFMFSYFAPMTRTPILHTIHRDFFENPNIANIYKKIGITSREHFCFVSHLAYNRSLIRTNIHTVQNGIDLELYPESPQSSFETYLWLSRIDPLKGPHIAIEAVNKAQQNLIVSGDIDRTTYQDFFNKSVKPNLGQSIRYESAQGYKRKVELYQNAKAFVFPIQWEEPFGLVVVEALSCGTPVITFRRGAMAEIIEDGVTGYLVDPQLGADGIAMKIRELESLSKEEYMHMRRNCRQSVEERFGYRQMAIQYEALYTKIIAQ